VLKIGTSLGRCLRSLLDGEVEYEDVFVIIANTRSYNVESLIKVVEQYYYYPPRRDYDLTDYDFDSVKYLAQRLWHEGKIHQFKNYEQGHQHTLRDTWLDIVPSASSENEGVHQAWQHYRMLAALAK